MKSKKRFLASSSLLALMIVMFFSVQSSKAANLYQATETPSPTITTKPLIVFETPTPMELSRECPEDGIIDGWMTVTPSVLWMSYCAHCVVTPLWTSTAKPATAIPTFNGTGTPPENTPTPTPTITPTQEYTGGLTEVIAFVGFGQTNSQGSTWACTILSEYQAHCAGTIWLTSYRARNSAFEVDIRVDKTVDDRDIMFVGSFDGVGDTQQLSISYSYDEYLAGLASLPYDGIEYEYIYSPPLEVGRVTAWHDYQFYAGEWNEYHAITGEVEVYLYPHFPPEGTPTPSPDSLYCDAVHGESGESPFGYDGITYGAMYCVDLLPFEISILGVDLSIPHFAHICIQDVSLGKGRMFGMEIDLDVALLVMGVAWAVRNLFIS